MNIEDTQQKFLEKASENGHSENKMLRAVLFRKHIKMGKKINERKNKKTDASALNTQSMIQEENKDEQPCALENKLNLQTNDSEAQMEKMMYSYLEKFDQKLDAIVCKLSQMRNVVNGLVHDMNNLKNPSVSQEEKEEEEEKRNPSSSRTRGKGTGRGRVNGRGRGAKRGG